MAQIDPAALEDILREYGPIRSASTLAIFENF